MFVKILNGSWTTWIFSFAVVLSLLYFGIAALYGSLFTENTEAAFANYRLWESAGFVMTYAYQNSIQTAYKLYICLAFLGVGMIGYTAVEIMEKRKQGPKAAISGKA